MWILHVAVPWLRAVTFCPLQLPCSSQHTCSCIGTCREYTAEIMFETFNVPGLYIGVQAVLALYAGFAAADKLGKVSMPPCTMS